MRAPLREYETSKELKKNATYYNGNKNKNMTLERSGGEGREISQKNLEYEELEMGEFEAFKKFRDMRKRQMERNEWKIQIEKEWDLVSIHTSQTNDLNKTGIKDKRNEEKLSKKEVISGPSCSKKTKKNSHKDREVPQEIVEAK